MLVADASRLGAQNDIHHPVANGLCVGDTLDQPAVSRIGVGSFSSFCATTRVFNHDVGDSVVPLQRTLIDANVLDVFEGDGDFVNNPDTAAYPQAAGRHDVPGRIDLQM